MAVTELPFCFELTRGETKPLGAMAVSLMSTLGLFQCELL